MGGNVVGGGVLVGALSALLAGCSLRVPVPEVDFSPEEKVVLTFQDGAQLTGRVDSGETILYRESGSSYRGQVESVDETEIVLAGLVALEDNSVHYQQERMQHFRLYVDDEERDRLILSRDHILQVERIVSDTPRPLKRIVFWTFGAGVAILAARDHNI
jgi:hypothetical protein